jgi:hypothetical protein
MFPVTVELHQVVYVREDYHMKPGESERKKKKKKYIYSFQHTEK